MFLCAILCLYQALYKETDKSDFRFLKVVYFIYQNQKWTNAEYFSSETSRKFNIKSTQYIEGTLHDLFIKRSIFNQSQIYWNWAEVLIRR